MAQKQCKIGVVGLGVMGRNLVLNIAEHGFPVAGETGPREGHFIENTSS